MTQEPPGDMKSISKARQALPYGPPPFDLVQDLKTIWREWQSLRQQTRDRSSDPAKDHAPHP